MGIVVASRACVVVMGFVLVTGSWVVRPRSAHAQAVRAPSPSATPAAPPASSSSAPAPAVTEEAPANDDTAPLPVPTDLTQAHAGGITADQVSVRAATTSWNARANEETLRAAAARVDEAWASFLPRLSGVAKYTRLSNFAPPQIPFGPPGSGLVVAEDLPMATTPGPLPKACVTTMGTSMAPSPAECFGLTQGLSFPLVLDNYLLQATITVPISDYFLRIDQNYTSATHSADAARWDVVTARATAGSNAKVTYYTWLRSRGAIIVAVQAINDQRTHLRDARNQFAVGNASKADVLRAETAVASAELALIQAKNLASLTEKQLRVAVHVGDERTVEPGEDLDGTLPPVQGNLPQLINEALSARPEVKSAEANAQSARESASSSAAGRYPNLSAFGDGILGNPNPRVFPNYPPKWFGTWDVGAQLTWSPNDTLVANGAVRDAEARAASIEANRNNVRDGIEVEVTQYWQNVRQADFSIESSTRELSSATEAYRVARELFNNGRGTSTTLTDAETDLTRARLDLLNSKADAHIARIQLEHALGRDAIAPAP